MQNIAVLGNLTVYCCINLSMQYVDNWQITQTRRYYLYRKNICLLSRPLVELAHNENHTANLYRIRYQHSRHCFSLQKTTGLVGLAVSEAPHDRLRILYTKIFAALQNIPRTAAYRIYTEKIVNERLNLIKTEPDVQKLENKINSGQIEEVILQAESELSLARKMAQWRPWEPLVEEPPVDQWKWPI